MKSLRKTWLKLCLLSVCSLGVTPAFAAKDVVVAVSSTLETLDPYDSSATLTHAVSKSFYEGLYSFDKEMKLRPILAESYTVSDNGLEYTFKLKSGVMFHDGTPFNADAVKANFERVLDPNNALKRRNMFNIIAKIDVIDDLTVKMTLHKPYSPFINNLAHPSGVMISPSALKKHGKDIAYTAVGTGPFKFVKWDHSGEIKVAKNQDYRIKGLPKVDTILWKPVIDSNTRSAVLQTGEAHFAFSIPFEQIKLLEKNKKLDVISVPSLLTRYIAINNTKKPFDDIRVRQALNYAINKEAVIKVAYSGYAEVADSVVANALAYSKATGPWPYDPKKAKELLKEAGYPDGFKTTLWAGYSNPTVLKILQVLQQQLAQVGIKADLQMLEVGQRDKLVISVKSPEESESQLLYFGWAASTGEIDWALTPIFATKSFPPAMSNFAYYSNTDVDKVLEQALATTNDSEKEKLYAQAQQQIWNDAPWVFLLTEKLIYAKNKQLSGMYVMPDGSFNYEQIDLQE